MPQVQHRALNARDGRKQVSGPRTDTVAGTNPESDKYLPGRGGFLVPPQSHAGQVGKKDLPLPHCISAQATATRLACRRECRRGTFLGEA